MLVLETKGGLFEGMSASSRTCELTARKEMGPQPTTSKNQFCRRTFFFCLANIRP
jgi:hypothetical protein